MTLTTTGRPTARQVDRLAARRSPTRPGPAQRLSESAAVGPPAAVLRRTSGRASGARRRCRTASPATRGSRTPTRGSCWRSCAPCRVASRRTDDGRRPAHRRVRRRLGPVRVPVRPPAAGAGARARASPTWSPTSRPSGWPAGPAHPAYQPLVEAGLLDFAVLDADRLGPLELVVSGRTLGTGVAARAGGRHRELRLRHPAARRVRDPRRRAAGDPRRAAGRPGRRCPRASP